MTTCPYGFRLVGDCSGERRLVLASAAFAGYAACDQRAEFEREGYLSAFQFGADFRELLEAAGSVRGFAGACWSAWLWWDIDRPEDLDAALLDARRLTTVLLERYPALSEDDVLVFYSGSKGFHVGMPACLWQPAPTEAFNRVARRFAESVAERSGVQIDSGVYDKVRPFRAPNSRHGRTGRFKRRLSYAELMGLSLDAILRLAERPEAFDVPTPAAFCDVAATDWRAAESWVVEQAEAKAQHRAAATATPSLNRATLDFIRNGADVGDRHRLLFSAAANLAEFSCPPALAHALLSESALDSGLTPTDVRRQIDCGLSHVGPIMSAPLSSPSVTPVLPPNLQEQLTALWRQPQLGAGDAWEPPANDLPPNATEFPFWSNTAGPYETDGGRR